MKPPTQTICTRPMLTSHWQTLSGSSTLRRRKKGKGRAGEEASETTKRNRRSPKLVKCESKCYYSLLRYSHYCCYATHGLHALSSSTCISLLILGGSVQIAIVSIYNTSASASAVLSRTDVYKLCPETRCFKTVRCQGIVHQVTSWL